MLRFTQHDIRIGIKKGFSFDDFCTKYQCSLEDFKYQIRQLYPKMADKTLKEIEQNTRRGFQKLRRNKFSSNTSGMQTLEDLHSTSSLEGATVPATPEKPLVSPSAVLDQLRSEESKLSHTVICLESKHKSLINQHRQNLTALYAVQTRLTAIEAAFQSVSAEYERLVIDNNSLIEQIDEVNTQRSTESLKLQEIRRDIEQLKSITLCVYTDGKIEPMDEIELNLDDTGNEKIYYDLINQQSAICQDLRLCDIATLARVKAITGNSEFNFTFLFEDEALESHYQQIS